MPTEKPDTPLSARIFRMPRMLLIGLIKLYRLTVSPWLGPGTCRFVPTCSDYAIQALDKYGAVRGSILAVWRILRCNPWNRGATFDPPRWFTEKRPQHAGGHPHDE